ncbi:MAG: hypothetical protein LBB85_11670 [Dysgonamonadaceae bacterium]|jgi:hypothetical protein|nr:hypothetical protein [Dysgonamonadaceae bacterium]
MRVFEVDIRRLVVLLLPTMLRKEFSMLMLWSMTAPVVTLYDSFMRNRSGNLYRLKANGQVCYLRRTLNDAFPAANGKIKIYDGGVTGEWLYAWDEGYNSYNYYLLVPDDGVMLWDGPSILSGKNHFVVVVPALLRENPDNITQLRAIVNSYKLLSKSYSIIYE